MIEVRPGGRRRIDRVLAPDYADGLDQLTLGEVRARRDEAAQEETDLSYLRRMLHGRIDIVRAELRRRVEGATRSVVEDLPSILADNALGPATGSGRYQTMEPTRAEAHRRHIETLISDVDMSDVGSRSGEELESTLGTLTSEENSVSQRRREVQRVMDVFNAEIGARYARGDASVDDRLAEQTRPDDSGR